MGCCFNVACFFCTLCVFIGLASLVQLCLGIYLTFIQADIIAINRLVKTDKYDSYLFYILLVFIGLGLVSLALSIFSIYGAIKRLRSLSLFVAVLWVFSATLNLVLFAVSLLYYYFVLPQLPDLLIRSLRQSPITSSNILDNLQMKHICCGIYGKDDYKGVTLDPFPSSCCRVPNCWRDMDINEHNGLNQTISLMHPKGCYPIVNKYVTMELWVLVGVAGICALLQMIAILLMCTLHQRYKKFDDDPKFVINHLASGIPINANANNSKEHMQGSAQTIEETVEITQI